MSPRKHPVQANSPPILFWFPMTNRTSIMWTTLLSLKLGFDSDYGASGTERGFASPSLSSSRLLCR